MNLNDPIQAHATSRPNRRAIIASGRSISWSQLDCLIWSTALKLSLNGFKAGERVGIVMINPVIHVITSLALARLGLAHIAIPASDSDAVRNKLIKQLELIAILSDVDSIAEKTPKSILLKKLSASSISIDQQKLLGSADGDLTWLILQSSGTTGEPKFAELTHKLAIARFNRFLALFDCNHEDVFWAASRPDFVVAKQRLTFSLMAGAAVFLPATNTLSPKLLQDLNEHGITLALGTPSHLHQITAIAEPIPSLRAFEVRSAFVSEKLRSNFKSTINTNLYIVYGTNEGDALSIASPELQLQAPNTVGYPSPSIQIEVVDENHMPASPLRTGEIRVQGPGVITSYLANPEASARSFKEGWFYPGDHGYFTEQGALILQGRVDDMMIFAGINIYPAEIENVLLSHPAVTEAAAFSMQHDRFQDVPVAAVSVNAKTAVEDLMAYCKALLGIKHPKRILIVNQFPRNPMGKILKKELSLFFATQLQSKEFRKKIK